MQLEINEVKRIFGGGGGGVGRGGGGDLLSLILLMHDLKEKPARLPRFDVVFLSPKLMGTALVTRLCRLCELLPQQFWLRANMLHQMHLHRD